MGVWGTGIMDNDLAQDIKIAFDDSMGARFGVEATIQRIKEQYRCSLDDTDEYPILILALAKLSLEDGEVPETLRCEAVDVLESGRSLALWEDSPEHESRRLEEARLLADLKQRRVGRRQAHSAGRVRLKIGDVVEIPLSNGTRAYGQYVFDDEKTSELLQVFRATSDKAVPIDEVVASGPLFPPVFTPISKWVREGIWTVVGNSPVTGFRFPKFRSGLENKEGRVTCWWIYDGEKSVKVGKLPPEYAELELEVVLPPDMIARRIETGRNALAERKDGLTRPD